MFRDASSGRDRVRPFGDYFIFLGFKPVQDDFQHDFSGMADESDGSVVLAEIFLISD